MRKLLSLVDDCPTSRANRQSASGHDENSRIYWFAGDVTIFNEYDPIDFEMGFMASLAKACTGHRAVTVGGLKERFAGVWVQGVARLASSFL